MIIRSVSLGKYESTGLLFTIMLPEPGPKFTCAIEDFLLPTALYLISAIFS
jgi:hypothetical protein